MQQEYEGSQVLESWLCVQVFFVQYKYIALSTVLLFVQTHSGYSDFNASACTMCPRQLGSNQVLYSH